MPFSKEALDYAWNWFEYHAGQRLLAFRFYLVILGILVVGFHKGIDSGHLFFASIVGYLGAFVSVAFLFLEIRNEELVNVGRNALKKLESYDEIRNVGHELQLLQIDRSRNVLLSHKFWLRAIYGICVVLFLLGAFKIDVIAKKYVLSGNNSKVEILNSDTRRNN